mmetsp:Transcript_25892/g.74876  ORF Transcript_25892/g.74876 Transcript_25892/m.74876 type:complete len:120 (-) Transcript_25892:468-827(-)
MRIRHADALADEDYLDKYYAQSDQIMNLTGLTLVAKAYQPFARKLMSKIRGQHFLTQVQAPGFPGRTGRADSEEKIGQIREAGHSTRQQHAAPTTRCRSDDLKSQPINNCIAPHLPGPQ